MHLIQKNNYVHCRALMKHIIIKYGSVFYQCHHLQEYITVSYAVMVYAPVTPALSQHQSG